MTNRSTILLTIPSLALHDAMGHDLLIGGQAFKKAGFDVKIFAEHVPSVAVEDLVTLADALKILARKETTLFYHMGVYWHLLPQLLKACRGKVIMKYHNMTPPKFFQKYDPQSVAATRLGLEQLNWLINNRLLDGIIADSEFNLDDLNTIAGSSKLTKSGQNLAQIAPFVSIADFQLDLEDPDLLKLIKRSKTNVLFVGRVVPNKGHVHLLATIKSYEQLYGPDIQLIICGGLSSGFRNYKNDLLKLIDLGEISSKVVFVHDADARKLGTLYRNSQLFLCMSEHEGFCVPVVEAQMMGLPVIAWDQAAVGRTVGDGGIVLKNLNYDLFATAIHHIQSDAQFCQGIRELGHKNAKRFSESRLSEDLVQFVQRLSI